MCVFRDICLEYLTQCANIHVKKKKKRKRCDTRDYIIMYNGNTILWFTCWCCRQLKKSVSSWQSLCTDRDPEFWSKQDSWQLSDLATSQHFLAASSHFISVSAHTIIKRSLGSNKYDLFSLLFMYNKQSCAHNITYVQKLLHQNV